MTQQRALRETEAAAYIGYSKFYLRECRMGRLGPGPKYIKINRKVLYLREDLDEWLDSFTKINVKTHHTNEIIMSKARAARTNLTGEEGYTLA